MSRDNPEHYEKGKKIKDHCEVVFDKVDDLTEKDEVARKRIESLESQLMERTAELTTAREVLAKEVEERRKLEGVLKEWNDMYRIYFTLSQEVMFTWNNEFRVLSISPNVERMLGYRAEEIVGRRFDEIGLLDPSDLDEAIENAQRLLSGKKLYSSIFRFIARDGSVRFGELSEAPVIKDGKVIKIVTVARGVAEKKDEDSNQLK